MLYDTHSAAYFSPEIRIRTKPLRRSTIPHISSPSEGCCTRCGTLLRHTQAATIEYSPSTHARLSYGGCGAAPPAGLPSKNQHNSRLHGQSNKIKIKRNRSCKNPLGDGTYPVEAASDQALGHNESFLSENSYYGRYSDNSLLDSSTERINNSCRVFIEANTAWKAYSMDTAGNICSADGFKYPVEINKFVFGFLIMNFLERAGCNTPITKLCKGFLSFAPRALVSGCVYLKRYVLNFREGFQDLESLLKVYFACCILARKYDMDNQFPNITSIRGWGIEVSEINYLEALLINSLNYNLRITNEEYKKSYYSIIQEGNYIYR